jgi:glutathione S-transferase
METLRIYGTPLSHFARKIRILLEELAVPYDFVRTQTVLATDADAFGANPLRRVPTLAHAGNTVIESDHIARYVVRAFDPADRFGVRSETVRDLNRLAVIGGVMDNEVVLLLAKRGGGVPDMDAVTYFKKLHMTIEEGLAWLDADTAPDAGFDYRDIAAVCMWQHLHYYALVPDLAKYGRLAARIARFAERPSVARTTPEASLAEARAAGWTPA